MKTANLSHEHKLLPDAASMVGPIHAFGSSCFFLFAIIYLLFVHSFYMFLSNSLFGVLSGAGYFLFRQPAQEKLRNTVFLTMVYLGLVNVAGHLGAHLLPMVFWGISVSLAAAFLLDIKGVLLWIVLATAFYPVTSFLKRGPLAGRVIPLDPSQQELLSVATYLGLLSFLAYTFVLFRLRLNKAIASRDEHRDALRRSEIQHLVELKQAELERHQLETRLFQNQKQESLGLLAGGIAHDFNNLLTGIIGNLNLARKGVGSAKTPEVEHALRSAETASLRAAELTRQMLAYSGRARVEMQPLDLNAALEEMADLVKSSVPKLVHLQFELAEHSPWIQADVAQIRQIIMNLIINAAEAIGDKAGVVTLRTSIVKVREDESVIGHSMKAVPCGDYACLEVIDDGCGMDDGLRSRIFDPFFTTKFSGRGLGLAAVLGLVNGHQGEILVVSAPNKGSTFRILLPLGTPSTVSTEEASVEVGRKGKGRILVIDDEEMLRDLIKTVLQEAGFEVLSASDGCTGAQLFAQEAATLSLVLLDLTMPGQGGLDTFKQLRGIRSEVPVVVMSGYVRENVEPMFAEFKPAAFLEKPFGVTKLLEVLGGLGIFASSSNES